MTWGNAAVTVLVALISSGSVLLSLKWTGQRERQREARDDTRERERDKRVDTRQWLVDRRQAYARYLFDVDDLERKLHMCVEHHRNGLDPVVQGTLPTEEDIRRVTQASADLYLIGSPEVIEAAKACVGVLSSYLPVALEAVLARTHGDEARNAMTVAVEHFRYAARSDLGV